MRTIRDQDWPKPPVSAHLSRHTLDGSLYVFLAEALLLPTGLLTVAFLTRKLGQDHYGLYTLAATLVAWVEWSIASLFSRATIKFVGEADDWRPVGTVMMRLHLAVSVGVAVLLWLLATPLARLLNELVLATYFRLFALGIPLSSMACLHQNLLIGIGGFRPRALAGASRWIARLLLIVVLVEAGLSVPGAILGSIGASLVEVVIGRFYIRPALFCRSTFPARQLWGYAVPLSLCALSMCLYDKLDLFALKVLGGTASQAGLYGAAQNLAIVPGLFAFSFAPLLLSTLSRMLRAGDGRAARETGRNAMRLIIALLPFAGMTAGAAPEIVSFIFGAEFLPASLLLALLIFGALALAMISVTMAILTAAGKPTWTFALTGPLLPLAVAGHLLFIPWLGAMGASLVTTVVASFGALAAVLTVYRIWRILPPAGTLGRSTLVCGLAYLLAALWPTPGILLLLKLPVIAIIIGMAFLMLGECSTSEITLARTLLRWRTLPTRGRGKYGV